MDRRAFPAEIERARRLQRAGIRLGKRSIYWIGYWTESGEWVRECYPRRGPALDRAEELAKRFKERLTAALSDDAQGPRDG